MNTLYLTIKRKWFDMILSGEKTEDYREIKDYWNSRLKDPSRFQRVVLRNGYSKTAPSAVFMFGGIEKRTGKPEWGAIEGKEYYCILLGPELPF